ncbi:unnamed protein product [Prunus armeniaca]|uniref:Uncharacterized protein n=1 Tax=Prunus armeniaca TaxID=36596 RepID=A0A6J5UGP2_PRUAR|nr:unnamed protein product [Prunus armeniaca]
MVRTPCRDENGMKKGTWTPEEDRKLIAYVIGMAAGIGASFPGLSRCGKSCRLRWMNYLRPNIKRGSYSQEEEETIIKLHQQLGNRWSAIAAQLPGRTDNEIKNHWHTNLKKRMNNKHYNPSSSSSSSSSSSVTQTDDQETPNCSGLVELAVDQLTKMLQFYQMQMKQLIIFKCPKLIMIILIISSNCRRRNPRRVKSRP